MREAIDLRAVSARNLVLVSKPEDIAAEKEIVTQAHAAVARNMDKLRKLASAPGVSEEARSQIDAIDKIEQQYAPVAMAIVDLALQGKKDEAIQKMNVECRPLLAKLVKATEDYANATDARSADLLALDDLEFGRQRSYLITRNLTRALGAEPAALCSAVGKVADGDLTTQLEVRSGDTISVMAAVARMQASLVHVVATVRTGSEGVSSASAEIASGNNDLSARTEQQASALEETAASMEELSSTVTQNADNARQANQLAQSASSVAVKGGETMTEVVSSIRRVTDIMGEISAASTEQSQGVAQVGEAVTQLDQATQQNAALVEEMAAAASSLKTQAQELVRAVSVFNLGSQGTLLLG